ncbi:MAG: hypothetical protein ACFFFG_11230 [Candidatus Thorarchaeota archaeon]
MLPNNSENKTELEIKKQLLELTRLLEKNAESIAELRAEIDQNEEQIGQLQTLDQSLDEQKKLVTDLDVAISSQNEQISALQENIEPLRKRVASLEGASGSHSEQLNQHDQMLELHKNSINDRPVKTELEMALKNLMDTLSTEISSLSSKIQDTRSELDDFDSKTSERLISTDNLLENLKKVLSDLNIAKNDHAKALEEQRLATLQLKTTLKELISQSKSDQKTHFENFNRIIESLRENIHTELTLTTQSLKKSDIEILNEVNTHYMRKKVGQDLQDRFDGLSKELEDEAKKTREDLIKELQQSVNEYEAIMEQQAGKISAWSQELEQFQEEIMAIIERKVNEKYETVFSLLSQVVNRAEELALLIKTIEIQIPRSLPEITEDRETQVTDEIPHD